MAIAVVATLSTAWMFFFFQQSGWTGAKVTTVAILGVLTIGMIASCVSRRAWMVTSRTVAACIFLIYFHYFIYESLFSGQAMRVKQS